MSAYFSVLVGLVALIAATGLALGQYHPGEICHEECQVEYCDYYHDYCEYECYDVCYPYSPEDPIRDSSSVKGKQKLQAQMPHVEPGKAVRHMRIQNPLYKTIQNGKMISRRGASPIAFALFDSCSRH